MELKEELDNRFSSSDWAQDAERLFAGDWQQRFAREDLHMVLGQLFGITFKAIGALSDAIVEIAEHIDTLEARGD